MNVAVTSVVKTGRRMQSSDNPMSGPRFWRARRDPRSAGKLHLTFGHDGFAPLETAFKNSIQVEHARDLDRLDGGDVILDDIDERPGLADLDRLLRNRDGHLIAEDQLYRHQGAGPKELVSVGHGRAYQHCARIHIDDILDHRHRAAG